VSDLPLQQALCLEFVLQHADRVLVRLCLSRTPQGGLVLVVSVHDVDLQGQGTASKVSLRLRHLLLTPPLNQSLAQLRSVHLPLHGHVLVGERDVTHLPYVGNVTLVAPDDISNANIQQTSNGFIIRGLVSVATWPGNRVPPCGRAHNTRHVT
jgi:hypothetical protein